MLQPEARWAEGWGVGWLNFHSKLVREVQRADENEVCKHSAVSLVLFLYLCMPSCAILTSQPDHIA